MLTSLPVDIILMEFKLPQISGEDVARMIRTSRNPNSNTPIVTITGYVKDLADPHHFDELMEKPATPSKLIDVLERHCFWKPPVPERPTTDRKDSISAKQSLIKDTRSSSPLPPMERFMASGMARMGESHRYSPDYEDAVSIGSSASEPPAVSRSNSSEWGGRTPPASSASTRPDLPHSSTIVRHTPASLLNQESAPSRLQAQAAERIPSPLSTHVTAGHMEDRALPSPPEMVPLPPSVTSTPVFARNSSERSIPTFSSIGAAIAHSRRTPPQVPADAQAKLEAVRKSPREDAKSKSSFSIFQSRDKGKDKDKEKEKEKDTEGEQTSGSLSTSPPSDHKSKASKRSSIEKKKEKQGKWKEGLEEADADDEDSLCGGKKPTKGRSIREIIQGVKWTQDKKDTGEFKKESEEKSGKEGSK